MVKIMKMLLLLSIIVLGAAMAGCSSTPEPSPVQPPAPAPVQPPAPAPVQPSPGDNLAPDFQLQSLDGQTVSLSSLRGRPVLLNFWATWCGPCRMEMPFIQGVFEDEEWIEKGLVILAINIGEDNSRVAEFMEHYDLSFPVLLDTDRSVAKDYYISGIPTTFFVDKNGIIMDMKVGAFTNKAEIDWRLVNSIMGDES